MDAVHIYELPIPTSFFESGGVRTLDVAVAHDPPTRLQRLDYLGNKIEFHVARGMTIDEIADTFANIDDDDGDDDEDLDGGDEDEQPDDVSSAVNSDASNGKPVGPPKISALGSKRVGLDASVKLLSRGANQRASRTFTQKLATADPGTS